MSQTRHAMLTARAAAGLASLSVAPVLAQAQAKPKNVTLKGTLACLGDDPEKDHGAGAQRSVYGHN